MSTGLTRVGSKGRQEMRLHAMARGHEVAGEYEWMLICRPRPHHHQIKTRDITVHDNPIGANHVIGASPRGIHPETDTDYYLASFPRQ